jgi:signal transduction histidine kinase
MDSRRYRLSNQITSRSLGRRFYVHLGLPAYKELEFARLKSLGYQLLLIDDVGTRPPKNLYHTYIYDPDRSTSAITKHIREFAASNNLAIGGVFTFCDCSVDSVNDVSKALGLDPVFKEPIDSIRDKHGMRKRLESRGYFLKYLQRVTCPEEIPHPAPDFFPLIVKPVDSLDSRAVSKVANVGELRLACEKVFTASTLLPTDAGPVCIERVYGMKPHAVIETYTEGYEYSVEVIIVAGTLKNYFTTFKRNSGAPFFYENGHTSGLNPLTPKQNDEIVRLISDLIAVNGYYTTLLHIEIRITPEGGVFLIECNSRLCGDQISDLVDKAFGTHMVDALFRYQDGEGKDLFPKVAPRLATRLYLTSERQGSLRIRKTTLAGYPIDWWKKNGELVQHVATQGASRVGAIEFDSESADELAAVERCFQRDQSGAFDVQPIRSQSVSDFLSRRIRRLYFWVLLTLSVILIGGIAFIQWREGKTFLKALGNNIGSSLLQEVVDADILPIAQKLKAFGLLDIADSVTVADRDLACIFSSNRAGLPNSLVYGAVNPHLFEFKIPIEADGIVHGYLLFNRSLWHFWGPTLSMAAVILATLISLYFIITRHIVPTAIRATGESTRKISELVMCLGKELRSVTHPSSANQFTLLENAQKELTKMPVEFSEVSDLREITSEILNALKHLSREIEEKGKISTKYRELHRSITIERERQKAIEEVSRQVAHDIRSPLTALKIATEDLKLLPENIRLLIQSATHRINGIANDLLDRPKKEFSSPDTGLAAEPVLLCSVLDSLLAEKRVQFENSARLTFRLAPIGSSVPLFVQGHKAELMRVVSNIVDNAAEASTASGNIDLSVFGLDGFTVLLVKDFGHGISPEVLNRLGQRGVTEGKPGGSGLGLYHAKSYLESIGGRLEIESAPGLGTEVKLFLPSAPTPRWFAQEIPIRSKSTVVVLDDDESVHQIWESRFKDLKNTSNISLVHFSKSHDLIDWCSLNQPTDSLFLLDFELLGDSMTGLSVASKLDIAPLSVLVTSHSEEASVISQCDKLGMKLLPKFLAGQVAIRTMVPVHAL